MASARAYRMVRTFSQNTSIPEAGVELVVVMLMRFSLESPPDDPAAKQNFSEFH
jgi:hypothetical protein